MEMATITELIQNVGFSVVLMAYFLIKDWKFNQTILDVLADVREVLAELKTWHAKEEAEK